VAEVKRDMLQIRNRKEAANLELRALQMELDQDMLENSHGLEHLQRINDWNTLQALRKSFRVLRRFAKFYLKSRSDRFDVNKKPYLTWKRFMDIVQSTRVRKEFKVGIKKIEDDEILEEDLTDEKVMSNEEGFVEDMGGIEEP